MSCLNLFGGTRVLAAVSGGADSMFLAHNLLTLKQSGCVEMFVVAHYNHNLRQSALRDELFVRNWCAEHGVECVVDSGDVAAHSRESGKSVEHAARDLRYAFLRREADRRGLVALTAHNAEDNAETVLFNLSRGSGGLRGICPRSSWLVRPMLHVFRSDIERYLAEAGQPYCTDESNFDTAYTRNYIRATVMPRLKEVNPRLTQAISRAVDIQRCEDDYLNAAASSFVGADGSVALSGFLPLHKALKRRVLLLAFGSLPLERVDAIITFAERSFSHINALKGEISLPGGKRVVFSRGNIRVLS